MNNINLMKASMIDILLGTKSNDRPRMNVFPQPDFTKFDYCTKTAPAMSEEEFQEAIIERAKKDAAAGICGGQSAGYRSLMKSYVSVASPDRKGIIANATNKFTGKCGVTFAEFKDASKQVIAHYSQNNGWTMVMSKAEMTRTSNFSAIYIEAWREAYYGKGDAANDAEAAGPSGSTFSVSV